MRQQCYRDDYVYQPANEDGIVEFGWYCVQTKVGSEELAQRNLDRQGFETYLPMTKADLRKQRARDRELEPLFKSYLFLHLSEQAGDWSPIKYTIGVLRLVKFGGHPARVPDGLITELRERENEMGLHAGTQHDYKPGDVVRIRAGGYFEYCEAILKKATRTRVLLLMNILGRETEICIARKNIEPTS